VCRPAGAKPDPPGVSPLELVPRHDHRTGRERDAPRATREPGEERDVVGTRRIIGEVVLGRPEFVVAEFLGEQREPHLVAHHVGVAAAALVVLKDQQDADVHDGFPRAVLSRSYHAERGAWRKLPTDGASG